MTHDPDVAPQGLAPQRPALLDAYAAALPPAPRPAGSYTPVTEAGPLVFTAGHTHAIEGALDFKGCVGTDGGPSLDDARECARAAVRNCLATLNRHLGGLDRIEQVVQMTGYVAASPDFEDHPRVLDAASEELITVFGERGRPSRAAVGVASLPGGAVVEVSLTVSARPATRGPEVTDSEVRKKQ
ncbi:RidA family protein [Sinomonas humi]|uniref:RidA family protein n=1 Tax=Sinomonas humi TaxID=1338436 RepID=UPI000690954A|nr:RidA family protein [Sinomonas humi]